MRRLIYLLILISLFSTPVEREDVAKLLPIRAVAVYMDGDAVVLETDTEHLGRGSDCLQALENLQATTPAVVYLDTAEFLLISPNATHCTEQLRSFLKPAVKVCVCEAAGKVEYTAEYLDVHGNLPKLKDWKPPIYEHVEK